MSDRPRKNANAAAAAGQQYTGLIVFAVALGLWQAWVGLAVFGLGVLLMGIAAERES